VYFYIVDVLKRNPISEETTRARRVWLRVFLSKKVIIKICCFCLLCCVYGHHHCVCYREDFNSLTADGKATLIFNCVQYVIAKVSEGKKYITGSSSFGR
jgi:hypothetical protein